MKKVRSIFRNSEERFERNLAAPYPSMNKVKIRELHQNLIDKVEKQL